MKIVLPVLCSFSFTYAIAQENDKQLTLNDALQKFGFLEGKVVDGADTEVSLGSFQNMNFENYSYRLDNKNMIPTQDGKCNSRGL